MATSGTFAWNPTVAEVIDEAAERARVDPGTLTVSRQFSLRRSLNGLLQRWATERPRQRLIDNLTLALTAGDPTYSLPAQVMDILHAVIRRDGSDITMHPMTREEYLVIPDKTMQGRPDRYWIEKSGRVGVATATLTFTGVPVAAEAFVLNGVTFTARASGASGNEFNIGGTVTATANNVVAAVNGSASVGVAGLITASNVAGVVTFTADTPGAAGNALTLTEALTNASRTVFAGGQSPAVVTLWQVPENSADTIEYSALRRHEDIKSDMTQTPDVAYLWLEAMVDEMAARLYQKFGTSDRTDREGRSYKAFDMVWLKDLRSTAADSYRAALQEDRERVDTHIHVKYGRP